MPYAIITKPIGPICNMGCRYCFYLEKKQLFGEHGSFRMSPEVLETFIRQYLALRYVPEVTLISAEEEREIGAAEARKVQHILGLGEDPEKLVPYVNAEMSTVPFSVRAVYAIDWMFCP